ncbi:MAG: hypothetical protein COZ12_07755 [Deltaproteobacteria bacterium CG_4_10_14_3_um_filter_60_8]|nr:MAG: hypothetical protein AUK28_02515 [Desulfobacterales bacterium CG2_30_60_27]PIP43638.1 MAG: hypothetical protein COX17_05780 [Deltaproteobacteria bacterium CG23_combo_of_CG06-09_8_20_14_all_60_8]PIY20865.1 MAG: hypothetical protein COZ12_07755 [Deltaproteobacteria bacterium CG_4_10_14_3_um_filter_60_8]
MKLYAITIKPRTAFGTPLKGDTIFGHFCWQAANQPATLNGGLDRWIELYPTKPFAVFSTAWPRLVENDQTVYAVKRPDLSMAIMFPAKDKDDGLARLIERKANKKKKWLLIEETLALHLKEDHLIDDTALFERYRKLVSPTTARQLGQVRNFMALDRRIHNTINRLTQTTGECFAPFVHENQCYLPETELTIFCLLDPAATDIDRVLQAFKNIGAFGFGRDASSGLGRFMVGEWQELPLPSLPNANACYTLGPAVPEQGAYRQSFFSPFTRFGKHGDRLVLTDKPFKAPIVMADEGAVFLPQSADAFNNPYLGRAVTGISLADPRTVGQGYSMYLPCRLEVH